MMHDMILCVNVEGEGRDISPGARDILLTGLPVTSQRWMKLQIRVG